jgi:5'-deoxynucleotidase YfbR-like HD superfamily hydrolase
MTTDFFSRIELLELTRHQPQYGYALARVSKGDQSDLAQHHYLVTMIAWQLANTVIQAGGTINVQRVLELALVHDLGELFGGDIAAPYARENPAARAAAKAFEAENQRFIVEFFGVHGSHLRGLYAEERRANTDETHVVKMADFIECTHYKRLMGLASAGDIALVKNVCEKRLSLIQDQKIKATLASLLQDWLVALNRPVADLFETAKQQNHE